MAIYHAHIQVIGRSTGRSVVAAAAYRAASELHDASQNRTHDYTAKQGVVHSEIMLPEGALDRWAQGTTKASLHAARSTLWNEVEATERRKDAQLAREIEFAIPRELPRAEAIRLAQDFVREQFVERGMVADLNVHWDVGEDGGLKPHAHVMLTMRRVTPAGFGPKVREWNATGLYEGVRQRWAELANERLAEHGHDVRIDHRTYAEQGIALTPQHKIGPAGARRVARGEDAERAAEHLAIARRNGEAILADPSVVLDAITRQHSTFSRRDLARFVDRHTADAEQFAAAMVKVEASPELVRVGVDGRGQDRFSTREMLAVERRLEQAAETLAENREHGVFSPITFTALDAAKARGLELGREQRDAVHHVMGTGGLALVVGYAGTGKSSLLGVAREAWESAGYRVRGAALSGVAAEGLAMGSGISSATLAGLEFGWGQGRDRLGRRDVLVVDEAGMVGSRQLERVLSAAKEAGAKVVLVGDPEQLQAIEAGAAFRALAQRHGAAEVSEVRRQREAWQREATRELATARTGAALGRYERAGMVVGHATQDEARGALVLGWDEERLRRPEGSQVMLASTRVDVEALNRLARERLRAAGELGADQVVETERGERALAVGDRLMFLRNERGLGAQADGRGGVAVKNGTLGTVLAVEAGGERLTVLVDGSGGPGGGQEGKDVTFYLRDYGHVDHGYAATVHKAQGMTVDRAHVLASGMLDRHGAYVALSRHRDGVSLHWSKEEHGDRAGLERGLSRERAKDTTLDYRAEFAELRGLRSVAAPAPTLTPVQAERPKRKRAAPRPKAQVPVPPAPAPIFAPAPVPEPLLAAHRDVWGRDSFGRGTTPGEVEAVVALSEQVQKSRSDLSLWMRQTYRDPNAAWAELEGRRYAEGGPLGLERALGHGGPELLGELRGKTGWLASGVAKAERVVAQRSGDALPGALKRVRETEEAARRAYVAGVEAQRARDQVAVPGLSPAAWAALRAVEQAGEQVERGLKAGSVWNSLTVRTSPEVAEAWAREVVAQPEVAAELQAVMEAAGQRLGEDGVRELLRAARDPQGVGQREGVAEMAAIGRVLAMSQEGRRTQKAQERARESQRQSLNPRQGQRPKM
jgi:Ti-type conjugative transfer relaxase TraA